MLAGMSEGARKRSRAEVLRAGFDPSARVEVLAGELVEKAAPTWEHSEAQATVVGLLWPRFRGGSTGWWILTEPDVLLGPDDLVRPDLAGWRRERVTQRPSVFPIALRPDWVCEILSPSTTRRDLGYKRDLYFRAGVPHYWAVDVEREMLLVFRREVNAYGLVLTAGPDEVVRAEPFEALELPVGALFGRDVP